MSSLVKPLRRLKGEMGWLSSEFALSAGAHSRSNQLCCEMAVIRLHDAWSRFCRELIILSAYGHTQTLGGTPLMRCRADIGSRGDVVPVLLRLWGSRTIYEPKWEKAAESTRAASLLGIRNFANVSAALGATNSPAESVRNVRNFYAHRRKGACQRSLATLHFLDPHHPLVYELNSFTSGGISVYDSWLVGFEAIAVAAIQ